MDLTEAEDIKKRWQEYTEAKWSEIAQLCPTLYDPVDCSPPGSSIHGILQARILEWVAISFSKNTQKNCTKKDLLDPDNHDAVITHPEPDILECKVKWALGSIATNKASGGDGILVELFPIVKDDAVKVRYSIYQQIWKTQQWSQD